MSSPGSASSSAPAPSNTACATVNFSVFPTNDTACAAGGISGIPSSYNDAFSKCCKTARVESWGSDCAKWCLSVDQTVADLTKCLQDSGVQANQIFCRGNSTASATGRPESSGSASATTGTRGGTATGSPTGTGAGASTSSPGVAGSVVVPNFVSKAGMGMLVVVLGSMFAGAMV